MLLRTSISSLQIFLKKGVLKNFATDVLKSLFNKVTGLKASGAILNITQVFSQPAFTCSKLTIKTEQGLKIRSKATTKTPERHH